VLGFSTSLYQYYRNAWGQPRSIVVDANNRIVTEQVVNMARTFFDCMQMNGVELENQGGQGTAGSHWEMRIFRDEYMVGILPLSPKVGTITLGLLEDTGWYKPQYEDAQRVIFGEYQGCDFVNKPCLTPGFVPTTQFPRFFPNPNIGSALMGCSPDRTYAAAAYVKQYGSQLPYNYYYANSGIGGLLPLADFCPVWNEYGDPCQPETKCIINNLVKACPAGGCPSLRGSCLRNGCSADRTQLRIFMPTGTESIVCPPGGGLVTLPGVGWFGSVLCPPVAEICGFAITDCPQLCWGRGRCVNGTGGAPTCKCNFNYLPPDCATRATPKPQGSTPKPTSTQKQATPKPPTPKPPTPSKRPPTPKPPTPSKRLPTPKPPTPKAPTPSRRPPTAKPPTLKPQTPSRKPPTPKLPTSPTRSKRASSPTKKPP